MYGPGTNLLNMNCAPCSNCEAVAFVGCFDPCGEIEFAAEASVSGEFTLKVGYLGNIVTVTAEQTMGEPITFPLEGLNENFTFTGKVYNPEGVAVALVEETTCIQFATSTTYVFPTA